MTQSAAATSPASPVDTPPVWDLTDFYPAHDGKEVEADIAKAEELAASFHRQYHMKIEGMRGHEIAQAITEYETLTDLLGKLGSYAQLLYATDMSNPDYSRFYQNMSEKLADISAQTLFFTLELNHVEEEKLQQMLESSDELLRYAPWLRDVRLFRPHQLSDELEQFLHDKGVTGASAWNRLFDETLAGLRFDYEGQEKTCEELLHLLSDKDGGVRKKAAKSLGKTFGDNIQTFAFITNTLAKDKAIEDKWRKFERPISSRNLANQVEDHVVDALLATTRDNYANLSHRYYTLKAQWMGSETMPYWDRNAPLPEDDASTYSWQEAVDVVLNAYEDFSPKLRKLGEPFFENNWIDVPPRPGKSPGAFAHPTVPSVHPYLLLNFQGKQRDVMTLAHELGHGVHQVLSAKQGPLMADTPLTLAETASVFGEQLTFRKLLKQADDPKQRKVMLANKVEDMLNTVVRQVAFCEFERKVHDARKLGELSPEQIGQFWMEVQAESLGDAITFDDEYQHFWCYIPHFIHSPFYVYAYAFGDCLVNALYGAYLEQPAGFEEKYFTMLEAGGTLHHKALLEPFGLDASDPAFWQKGMDVIASFIDELEALS
jgi:oligoendopeptidase F